MDLQAQGMFFSGNFVNIDFVTKGPWSLLCLFSEEFLLIDIKNIYENDPTPTFHAYFNQSFQQPLDWLGLEFGGNETPALVQQQQGTNNPPPAAPAKKKRDRNRRFKRNEPPMHTLNPVDDPRVKNAVAARRQRDRKKAETAAHLRRIAELEEQLAAANRKLEEVEADREANYLHKSYIVMEEISSLYPYLST